MKYDYTITEYTTVTEDYNTYYSTVTRHTNKECYLSGGKRGLYYWGSNEQHLARFADKPQAQRIVRQLQKWDDKRNE